MISEFEHLDASEQELMIKAPFLVCILVAGADGTIDRKEIREAINVAQKAAQVAPSLKKYYKETGEDFEDKLKVVLQNYPFDVNQRNQLIVEELAGLNEVLPRLNKKFATIFYQTMRVLAEKVAESSGGVLGIRSVGEEESRYLDLSMINDPSKVS